MSEERMNVQQKEKFMEVLSAFNQEEIEIIANEIPIELCIKRIERELIQAKETIEAMKNLLK